jgi:hypothetical protein
VDAVDELIADYRALRAHVLGPSDTPERVRARRAARARIREIGDPPELRSAFVAFGYWPEPLLTTQAIQSIRARKNVLGARAQRMIPELRARLEEIDSRLRKRLVADHVAAMDAKSDIFELMELTECRDFDLTNSSEMVSSTIDAQTVARAGLFAETWSPLVSRMLATGVRPRTGWLVFPYYRPGRDHPVFFRAKRTHPLPRRSRNKKGKAYRQPAGLSPKTGIYFPPQTRSSGALRNPGIPLIWTEGEKKALCLDCAFRPIVIARIGAS